MSMMNLPDPKELARKHAEEDTARESALDKARETAMRWLMDSRTPMEVAAQGLANIYLADCIRDLGRARGGR